MAAPDRALRLFGGEEPIMLDILIKGGDKGTAIYGKTLHGTCGTRLTTTSCPTDSSITKAASTSGARSPP